MDLLPDLAEFEGTELGLERNLEKEFWATTSLAGLQFYDYASRDPVLDTEVLPRFGDRLALMRRPDNRFDANAVETWWRNEYQLGHLPRSVAANVAPLLDAGKSLRAYVVETGNGRAWSLQALLIGAAAEPLHDARIARVATSAASEIWPTDRDGACTSPVPTERRSGYRGLGVAR